MESNPLASIEFVAFIAFCVWLVWWQRRSSRRAQDDAARRETGEPAGQDGRES